MNESRQIQVYVSSHFRDMQAEREHLAMVILPQLRALAEEREIKFDMAELRMGALTEAAAEEYVLANFPAMIHRCRPFFIGLLGEQYGWKPAGIPQHLLANEPWLQEQLKKRNSVLEMEFLHGALRAPELAKHACFYMRDPNYVNSLPASERQQFASKNATDSEKLQSLKSAVRRSGLTVRENYPNPIALGELILADFTKIMDELVAATRNRIVIHHVIGTKAHSVQEFNMEATPEILIGRDVTSHVKYPDISISRDHIRIARNIVDPNTYILIAKGRNGTLINNQEVSGANKLFDGDTVQVGHGGPVFRFEMFPKPKAAAVQEACADSPLQTATQSLDTVLNQEWSESPNLTEIETEAKVEAEVEVEVEVENVTERCAELEHVPHDEAHSTEGVVAVCDPEPEPEQALLSLNAETYETQSYYPQLERNKTNAIALAESECDRVCELFKTVCREEGVDGQVLRSEPYSPLVSVKFECWVRKAGNKYVSRRGFASIVIRAREFHRWPCEYSIQIHYNAYAAAAKNVAFRRVLELTEADIRRIVRHIADIDSVRRFRFKQSRSAYYQVWRPKNYLAGLKPDWPRPIAFAAMLVGLLTAPLFGIGLLIIVGTVVWADTRKWCIINSGKPLQEPRILIEFDSWQTLVFGLGEQCGEVLAAITLELDKAHQEGFSWEDETVLGRDGAAARYQLVLLFRRAISFVHVRAVGEDLYIGWKANLNAGTWREKLVGQGIDPQTGTLCKANTIVAGWHVPDETDITDANCIAEWSHGVVCKVINRMMVEAKIDQEIDFRVIRTGREGIVGRKDPNASKRKR